MDETILSPGPGGAPAPREAADIDEKILSAAVARGLITAPQGRAALEEARAVGRRLLDVLRERSLVSDDAARDLDDEMREDFVPGYRVLSKLGEGGMGVVYRALQKRLDREVALKVVTPSLAQNENYLRRFEREAKAVARLNHPNIVAAYDFGESKGRVFLAMEFVEGTNCADEVRAKGPMSEDRALAVVRDVAAGLAHAHAAGIIHRDIKPANILLQARRKGDTAAGTLAGAKVTDLGLARTGDSAGASDLTAAGTILGTPGYMPPEQAFGQEIDHRADIYALGATLYQLLTGIRPFEAATPVGVIARQQSERLPDPRDLRSGISAGVVALLQGMMARDPADRYGSYRELLSDLDRVRAGGAPERPLPPEASRSVAPAVDPQSAGTLTAAGPATLAAPPPSGASRSGPATVIAPGAGAGPVGGAERGPRGDVAPPAAPAAVAPDPPRSRAPLLVGVALVVVGGVAAALALGGGDAGPGNGVPSGASGVAPAVAAGPSGADPAGDADETAALRRAVAALEDEKDDGERIRRFRDVRARLDGSPRTRGEFEGLAGRVRARAEGAIHERWKRGRYAEALQFARAAEEGLGDQAGTKIRELVGVLEGAVRDGEAERAAIHAARAAALEARPLAVIAALDGFEARYGAFSPDLDDARRLLADASDAAPFVSIATRPSGAAVLVDGRDLGRTPFRGRIPAGRATITLTLDGYLPLDRTLDVARGTGAEVSYDLEERPPPDPEPAVRLVVEGDERPLWTGSNVGAWQVRGQWSVSDATRDTVLDGKPVKEPPAVLRGAAAAGSLATATRDLASVVRGAAGWRVEAQMVGARAAIGTARVELHFGVARDGVALVVGVDEQNAYLGRRDPAAGTLVRTHVAKGVAANARHTFRVERHGDVYEASVDGRRIGAVRAPAEAADGVPFRLAVEEGVGFFSDILVWSMAAR